MNAERGIDAQNGQNRLDLVINILRGMHLSRWDIDLGTRYYIRFESGVGME